MVGGYIYPFKVLNFGSNDLVKMFGTRDAVVERIQALRSVGKPAYFIIGAGTDKLVFPLTGMAPTSTGYTVKAGTFTITITIGEDTAVAVVSTD